MGEVTDDADDGREETSAAVDEGETMVMVESLACCCLSLLIVVWTVKSAVCSAAVEGCGRGCGGMYCWGDE